MKNSPLISSIDLNNIEVLGARVHNLKNIDVTIPRNKLTVITGLSGSGKSSLAFDTIFAEGQRRYMETFNAYARQFIGTIERPDVDKITGLSPVISIEQKSVGKNPRSTVGTITEIYDFFRLWYARAATAYSYNTGEKMVHYTMEKIISLIEDKFAGKKVMILAPVVKGRKGHYRELFEQIRKKGYFQVRVDGQIKEIIINMKTDRYKTHNIEIVVDKLVVPQKNQDANSGGVERLKKSIDTAMQLGKNIIMVLDVENDEPRYFSRLLMCPTTGLSYEDPNPNTFSYNSPSGYCPTCKGLGTINKIDINKIVPNQSLSIKKGAISPLGKYKDNFVFRQIEALATREGFSLDTPFKDLEEEHKNMIFNGSDEPLKVEGYSSLGHLSSYYDGILEYLENTASENDEAIGERYFTQCTCPECDGKRLNKIALSFKIADKTIADLSTMDIKELNNFLSNIEEKLESKQQKISTEILKEIRTRINFMVEVGLDYLSLYRPAQTLSGGESQRIRLATQIGSKLVNVLYILDEPSIGLHQRDNDKLIESLKKLRDAGNTVVVVEHDTDMIKNADYVIDIGPGAGRLGGYVVASCTPKQMLKLDTLTSQYISGKLSIKVPEKLREGTGEFIELKGCKGNNLKNVDIKIPLGKLVLVTGVSGSGKSTIINETLRPILSQKFYNSNQIPLEYSQITGLEHIDKVIEVDQEPIGRTPRSNPCTYTGIFTDIRKLYANVPQSKIMGYNQGRFSFNVKGGRCEECQGSGLRTIEMNFLPNVYVKCEACAGRRYNRETLEVRYKGKSISEVLDMTINRAAEFFENVPQILRKLKALQEVGMGYVTLGQSATTLSGGEAQRIKLASELAKKDTGKTLYILDEPTTGLHLEDIRVLMEVLNKLVDKGNTVVIIEHNLDVIKTADYIIDMGPEGGQQGGQIIAEGTPQEIIKAKKGYTWKYLKDLL